MESLTTQRTSATTYNTSTTSNVTLDDFCPRVLSFSELALKNAYPETDKLNLWVTVLYCIVAAFGALGNLLVIASVIRNPQMRTPRNLFIINLALSDFTMCTVTVPFTTKFMVSLFWDFGWLSCKIVSMLLAINVFVSTQCITAIGLDRYLAILFPAQARYQKIALVLCFIFTWASSVLLALPLAFLADVTDIGDILAKYYTKNYVGTKLRKGQTIVTGEVQAVEELTYACLLPQQWYSCGETQTPMFGEHFKLIYTIACFLIQYSLPLLTLTFVYGRIICRLRHRVIFRVALVDDHRRRSADGRRARTNILLISILVIFAMSWLPLNIYMLFTAIDPNFTNIVAHISCHMVGMISACANPILYGVFNENFRREFIAILQCLGIAQLTAKLFGGYAACCIEDTTPPPPGIRRESSIPENINGSTALSRIRNSRRFFSRGSMDYTPAMSVTPRNSLLNGNHLTPVPPRLTVNGVANGYGAMASISNRSPTPTFHTNLTDLHSSANMLDKALSGDEAEVDEHKENHFEGDEGIRYVEDDGSSSVDEAMPLRTFTAQESESEVQI